MRLTKHGSMPTHFKLQDPPGCEYPMEEDGQLGHANLLRVVILAVHPSLLPKKNTIGGTPR